MLTKLVGKEGEHLRLAFQKILNLVERTILGVILSLEDPADEEDRVVACYDLH